MSIQFHSRGSSVDSPLSLSPSPPPSSPHQILSSLLQPHLHLKKSLTFPTLPDLIMDPKAMHSDPSPHLSPSLVDLSVENSDSSTPDNPISVIYARLPNSYESKSLHLSQSIKAVTSRGGGETTTPSSSFSINSSSSGAAGVEGGATTTTTTTTGGVSSSGNSSTSNSPSAAITRGLVLPPLPERFDSFSSSSSFSPMSSAFPQTPTPVASVDLRMYPHIFEYAQYAHWSHRQQQQQQQQQMGLADMKSVVDFRDNTSMTFSSSAFPVGASGFYHQNTSQIPPMVSPYFAYSSLPPGPPPSHAEATYAIRHKSHGEQFYSSSLFGEVNTLSPCLPPSFYNYSSSSFLSSSSQQHSLVGRLPSNTTTTSTSLLPLSCQHHLEQHQSPASSSSFSSSSLVDPQQQQQHQHRHLVNLSLSAPTNIYDITTMMMTNASDEGGGSSSSSSSGFLLPLPADAMTLSSSFPPSAPSPSSFCHSEEKKKVEDQRHNRLEFDGIKRKDGLLPLPPRALKLIPLTKLGDYNRSMNTTSSRDSSVEKKTTGGAAEEVEVEEVEEEEDDGFGSPFSNFSYIGGSTGGESSNNHNNFSNCQTSHLSIPTLCTDMSLLMDAAISGTTATLAVATTPSPITRCNQSTIYPPPRFSSFLPLKAYAAGEALTTPASVYARHSPPICPLRRHVELEEERMRRAAEKGNYDASEGTEEEEGRRVPPLLEEMSTTRRRRMGRRGMRDDDEYLEREEEEEERREVVEKDSDDVVNEMKKNNIDINEASRLYITQVDDAHTLSPSSSVNHEDIMDSPLAASFVPFFSTPSLQPNAGFLNSPESHLPSSPLSSSVGGDDGFSPHFYGGGEGEGGGVAESSYSSVMNPNLHEIQAYQPSFTDGNAMPIYFHIPLTPEISAMSAAASSSLSTSSPMMHSSIPSIIELPGAVTTDAAASSTAEFLNPEKSEPNSVAAAAETTRTSCSSFLEDNKEAAAVSYGIIDDNTQTTSSLYHLNNNSMTSNSSMEGRRGMGVGPTDGRNIISTTAASSYSDVSQMASTFSGGGVSGNRVSLSRITSLSSRVGGVGGGVGVGCSNSSSSTTKTETFGKLFSVCDSLRPPPPPPPPPPSSSLQLPPPLPSMMTNNTAIFSYPMPILNYQQAMMTTRRTSTCFPETSSGSSSSGGCNGFEGIRLPVESEGTAGYNSIVNSHHSYDYHNKIRGGRKNVLIPQNSTNNSNNANNNTSPPPPPPPPPPPMYSSFLMKSSNQYYPNTSITMSSNANSSSSSSSLTSLEKMNELLSSMDISHGSGDGEVVWDDVGAHNICLSSSNCSTSNNTMVKSCGSVLHPHTCKPCAFFWNKGCTNSVNCKFCHEWHAPKKKKPMKEQRNLMIIARPDGKTEFIRCTLEEAMRSCP